MPNKIDTTGLKRSVATRADFIVRRAVIDIDRDLHTAARPHHQTGEMEGAIKVTPARLSPTLWRITASNDTIQAATTNTGARPHEIRPRTKQVLRFVMDGRVVFARVVSHPGNKGDRWFSKVMSPASLRTMLSRFVGR